MENRNIAVCAEEIRMAVRNAPGLIEEDWLVRRIQFATADLTTENTRLADLVMRRGTEIDRLKGILKQFGWEVQGCAARPIGED